jgi:hypothetical protein
MTLFDEVGASEGTEYVEPVKVNQLLAVDQSVFVEFVEPFQI